MLARKIRLLLIAASTVTLAVPIAWALGLRLGETKEQLELQYEISVTDHGTGRVTVSLTITDHGRLDPLSTVDLVIPSEDGTNNVDLSLSIALREVHGAQTGRVHLKRELAERAELQLTTSHLDGKQLPLTWYYHPIPLAGYLESGQKK